MILEIEYDDEVDALSYAPVTLRIGDVDVAKFGATSFEENEVRKQSLVAWEAVRGVALSGESVQPVWIET